MSWQPFFFLWHSDGWSLNFNTIIFCNQDTPYFLGACEMRRHKTTMGVLVYRTYKMGTYDRTYEIHIMSTTLVDDAMAHLLVAEYVVHVKLLKQLLHVFKQSPFFMMNIIQLLPKKMSTWLLHRKTCGTNFSIEYWNHKHKTDKSELQFHFTGLQHAKLDTS